MSHMAIALIAALLAHPGTTPTSTKRPLTPWPYEKLFKNADLVIIGRPVSIRDANADDAANATSDYLIGVITTFRVDHVVKGEHKEKELELVHFRMKEGANIGNGPLLVSFKAKPVDSQSSLAESFPGLMKEPQYMLFLKTRSDARWECVSGFDPLLSVKKLTRLERD